ncbi:MAG: S8 family serine peptidase [Bacteroidia bacterium]
MNKALQILSFTTFLFMVSCEGDLPIDLIPATDPNAIAEVKESNLITQSSGEIIKNQYIVMFKEDISYFERLDLETATLTESNSREIRQANSDIRAKRATAIESFLSSTLAEHKLNAQTIMSVYDIGRMKGGMVNITEAEAIELGKNDQISLIEPNEVIAMGLTPSAKGRLIPADGGPAKQTTPYNIKAVGGAKSHKNGKNWCFIIDSGIDLDHPELSVEVGYSRSFVPSESSPNDEFGHGTHVAGIIGAEDDQKGVVGVAPGAPLVALKVLDKDGYGTKDYLLQALSYVQYAAIAGDVVNISLGTDNSYIINQTILRIQSRVGVYFTIAAGNDGINAANISPANLQSTNIYIMGAINEYEALTTFSNFGQSVNILTPGESIYSTYKDGQYMWMSGTSMAAPHMAGILLSESGTYKVKKNIKLPSGNYAQAVKRE